MGEVQEAVKLLHLCCQQRISSVVFAILVQEIRKCADGVCEIFKKAVFRYVFSAFPKVLVSK